MEYRIKKYRRRGALTPEARLCDYAPIQPMQWFTRDSAPVLGPTGAVELLRPVMAGAPIEEFRCLYLNARHRPVLQRLTSLGTLDASLVHPREVFRPAVEIGAGGLIVAHNHPSGSPNPSSDDLALTVRLFQVGELLGVTLLDHLILTEDGYTSIRDIGWPA